jgi:uncharacterized protein
MVSSFIWYELLTNNPDAAATFYDAVFGWKVSDSGQAAMDYRIISMNGSGVGGLMALPPGAVESGMRPGWVGYVSVADVDKAVASITSAGGMQYMPATDVPGVGRLAMLADPQGAMLYVMKPISAGVSTAFAPGQSGHCGWNELHTKDWTSALSFYKAQFGWEKVHAMDMGPLGIYLQFNYGNGNAVGGMLNEAQAERPYWLYYFNVDDIESASKRVTANGGKALMEPHQVPTGDWIVPAFDPQGAMFAIVGPKR